MWQRWYQVQIQFLRGVLGSETYQAELQAAGPLSCRSPHWSSCQKLRQAPEVVVVNLGGGSCKNPSPVGLNRNVSSLSVRSRAALWNQEVTSAEHRTVLSVHFLSHVVRLKNFKRRIALSWFVSSSTSRGWSPAVRTCRCFLFNRYKPQLKQKVTLIKLRHRNKVLRSCNRSFYFLHSLVLSVVNHNDSAATLGLRE